MILSSIWTFIPVQTIIYVSLFALTLCVTSILAAIYAFKAYIKRKKAKREPFYHIALFHPYCNAGGGGERVLWCAVRALQNKCRDVMITIYTGDVDVSAQKILNNAQNIFNITVDAKRIQFVFLTQRNWVEAKYYPHFTLLMQSIGSLVLAIEALIKMQPDAYIDTMGYAFTLPIFKYLGKCDVGCYVHYPTISTDMLKRVKNRIAAHNNRSIVAKNPFLTWFKLTYYRIFAKAYGMVGRCAQTIMVNSSWTEDHILSLWDCPFKTHRVYPPCDVGHLVNLQHIDPVDNKIVILSVAQFRPEKDHPLMLQALYELRTLLVENEPLWNRIKLVIAGSCRNKDDEQLLQNMKDLSCHLSLENSVEFKVNVTHQELIQNYQTAAIGLHTMWNEHFGIGVVECMAAGLIVVANRSGGPMMDIIETAEGSQTGYLAVDALEYAECIADILFNTPEDNDRIRCAARAACERFSEKQFEIDFMRAYRPLLNDDHKVLKD